MSDSCKRPGGPYLRLRLRTLLLLIAVVALPAAWLSEQARWQRNAIAIVDNYGAVSYEKPSENCIIGPIQVWAAKLLGDDFAYHAVFIQIDADSIDNFRGAR